MRLLGFSLKVLGGLIGALTFFLLGVSIQNGFWEDAWTACGYVLALVWGLVAWGDKWHTRSPVLDPDVAERAATRRFPPGKSREWLPHEAWLEFPDPLPDVPDIIGDPDEDIPAGEVPPDENLRRLWTVRAQLAVYLDERQVRARSTFRRTVTIAFTAVGMAGGLSVALSGLPATGERLTLAGLLATAFLLWPFARNLLAHTEGLSLVAKRKAALLREEARLMAGDATRPGGAVGGDAVGPGIPYVPPNLSRYRAGH